MRIKVECGPPLTTFKAWFIVPAVSSVHDLKESLCADIPGLQQQTVGAEEIHLVLDGFELLDSSPIDVVRDGDLISIKPRAIASKVAQRKRKAESPAPSPLPKRVKSTPAAKLSTGLRNNGTLPQILRPSPAPSSSESDSDSETSSDSTSDSDSTDTETGFKSAKSDSDSDSSDTSVVSSSSSAPSERPSKPTSLKPPQKQITAKSAAAHVPPGQGKLSTKNRNLRRRRKKQYDLVTTVGDSGAEASNGVNSIPLGSRTSLPVELDSLPDVSSTTLTEGSPSTVQPTIMMASLSNKNKRRGFKQAMASKLPKKIVFATPDESAPSASAIEPALPFPTMSTTSEVIAAAPSLFPRLVPPSEKQENGQLPPNMVVTSIDVEEGMLRARRKNKNKKLARDPLPRTDTQEVESVVLDYGGEDEDVNMIPTQRRADNSSLVLCATGEDQVQHGWDHAEKHWDKLVKITQATQLSVGSLIGWKALAINPATFTPEFLLNIGRITLCANTLSLQPLHRPGAAEISFGGPVDEEGEDTALPDVETFEWEEVFSGDWRIVG